MAVCSNIPSQVCCCNITASGQPSSGEDKAYIGHVIFSDHKPNHAHCAMSANSNVSYVLQCKNRPTLPTAELLQEAPPEYGESGIVLPIMTILMVIVFFIAFFATWKIRKYYIPRIKELEALRNSQLTRENSRSVEYQ